MGRIEDTICEAIELIVDKTVNNASYDRTIQAIVKSCVDESTGKYLVQYQDTTFYAYSSNLDTTYSDNSSVYVLIPGNDMSEYKTILGSVSNLGVNYGTQLSKEEQFNQVGTNYILDSDNETEYQLSSYRNHLVNQNKYLEVLYSVDAEAGTNRLEIDAAAVNEYLKDADYFLCSGFFRTALPLEQKNQGNYGIIFGLDFGSEDDYETVYYSLDVDNMEGNPYELEGGKKQYNIYSIDGEDFYRISSVSIFTSDFPNHKNDDLDYDIFISDIEMYAVEALTEEELQTGGLTLLTPQGTFFTESALPTDTKLIEAELKIKGRVVDSDNISFYWFKENLSVTPSSREYDSRGGRGWECLNPYNELNTENGTLTKVVFLSEEPEYEIPISVVKASELRIKCVAIYNENSYSKIVTIKNYKEAVPEITIQSSNGTAFYFGEGETTLTCIVGDGTGIGYSYIWASEDKYGNTTFLEDNVSENVLSNVLARRIRDILTFKCSVADSNGNLLGTASIILSNSNKMEGTYTLVIENGNQTYQYNEYGISPANESLDRPISIMNLGFSIYNNLGEKLSSSVLRDSYATWRVPLQRTMLTGVSAINGNNPIYYTEDGELIDNNEDDELIDNNEDDESEEVVIGNNIPAYEEFEGVDGLIYKIRDTFYQDYVNNNIELEVEFQDQVLFAKTNLIFIKQGDDGTNGTFYNCKITPNIEDFSIQYPIFTVVDDDESGTFNFEDFILDNEDYSITSPFVVRLYESGQEIFCGSESDVENNVSITWEMLANHYKSAEGNNSEIVDLSDFEIDENDGTMKFTDAAHNASVAAGANTIKCTVEYEDETGEVYILYATLPITVVRLNSESDCSLYLKEDSGFRFVKYASDGTNPQFAKSTPFTLKIENDNEGDYIEDLTDYTFNWETKGCYYNFFATGGAQFVNSIDLSLKNNLSYLSLDKSESLAYVVPTVNYNGMCVNNTVACTVFNDEDVLIGSIEIPVSLFLNRYGFFYLNSWDGNSIEIDNEGGRILAPQMGAGKKENDNTFTGVLMGEVIDTKVGDNGTDEVGIFGYKQGERTFALNAETGDAYFKGTISNGSKDSLTSNNSGFFVDPNGYFSVGDGSEYIKWTNQGLDIQASHFTVSIGDSQSKDVQTILSEANAASIAALEVQEKADRGDFDGADGVGVDYTEVKYVVDSQGTTAPDDSANWQLNIPSSISPGQFLWTRTTIYYTDNNNSRFFTVSRQGENGAPGGQGTAGINTATVYLYQRATSMPNKPSGDLTYTFASASITSGSLGNWSQNIGSLEGTNPIWVTAAVASSNIDRDIISSNEWSTPIKMAQDGQNGQPGQQGTNGLNQATVYIYKRSSGGENAPLQTTYTFADGSFTVPSGWSKTIPASDKKPCYVSSAVAIGNGDTAILTWNTPSILVEDGSDGISPTVTTIEGGVEITDANGNKTYVYNGSNGQSYYTYIRYATDSNGSNMSASPTGKTYIGVYSGTASSAPSSASAYAPWMKYIGSDAETYYAFVKYATNNQGANMQDNPASGYDYVGTYTGTKSAPTAADFHWSKYTGEPGQPATQYYAFVKYATNNQGANMQDSPDATHIYVGTYAGTKSSPTAGDYEWSLYVGSNGVSVTAVKEVYFLTTGTAPAQSTLTNGTAISNNTDQTEHWTTVVPTYVTNGKYYKSLQTSLSSGTSPIFSTITLDEGLTTANANAAAAESLAQNANENASNALSKVQAKYANCSTQGNIAAKVATITPTVSNWSLFNGAEIFVKFSHANTATNPTLKINTTDAKPIKNSDGGDLTSTFYWIDNSLIHFVYDGANWRMLDIVTTEKYNTLVSNIDGISQVVGTKASQTDLTNLTTRVTTNETNISQTATSITSLVSNQDTYTAPDGTTKTNTIKSAIKQNADNISLRVEKNGVIAAINASTESDGGSAVKISADKVNIEGAAIFTGNGRLSQTSLNNSYDAKGAAATAESNAVSTAAADATSKANAAQSAAITAAASDATSKANAVNNALEAYKTSTNSTLSSLQNQVDGQVEVWYYNVDPTTSNPPASTWNTDTLKARHEGDLYYNIDNGHSWRWLKNGSTYSWQQIPDGDAAAALAKANEAMGLAGDKRRIFTAQPTPPYDVGDLWVSGSDIKYCKTSKSIGGSYAAADWTLTATDDTKANSAAYEEQYIYISKVSGTLSVGVNETWVSRSDDVQNIWTTKRPTYNSNYPVLFVAKQKKTVSQSNGTSCSCSTPVKDDTTTVIDGGHITTGTIDASRLNVSDIIADGNIIVQGDNISNLNNNSGFQTLSDVSSSISSAINNIEIGGRNLLGGTANLTSPTLKNSSASCTFGIIGAYNTTASSISIEAYDDSSNALTATETATGNRGAGWYTKPGILAYGDTVTFSCRVKASISTTVHTHTAWRNGSATAAYAGWTSAGNKTIEADTWIDYSYTFDCASAYPDGEFMVALCFTGNASGLTWKVAHAKLERGSKKTDWDIAPEEIYNNIKIGGRNLVSNLSNNWSSGSWSIPTEEGEQTVISAYNNRISLINRIIITPNTDYWVKVYTTKSNVKLLFRVCDSDGNFLRSEIGFSDQKWTSQANDRYIHLTLYENSLLSDIGINTKVKIEQGNMSTDWTPSLEDVDASAVAKTQRIYYRSNAVSSGVPIKPNGSGLPTTWVTEEGNKWNSNATTASGWSRKITSISDGTGENVTKYLYLWTATQKQMVDGTVAALTASDIALDDSTTVIDGGNIIAGTVTANQLNATDINASGILTAGAIQTNTITVGSLQDGIYYSTTSAMNNAIATALDDVEIGGRNLLTDSNASSYTKVAGAYDRYLSDSGNSSYTTGEFFEVTDPPVQGIKYGYRITTSTASSSSSQRGYAWQNDTHDTGIVALAGETYTLSCYVRKVSGTPYINQRYGYSTNNGSSWTYVSSSWTLLEDTDWTRVSYTFTYSDSMTNRGSLYPIQLRTSYIGVIEACGFKFEKGNKATDWTPSSEEMATDLDVIELEMNTNAIIYGTATYEYGNYVVYKKADGTYYYINTYIEDGEEVSEEVVVSESDLSTDTDGNIIKNYADNGLNLAIDNINIDIEATKTNLSTLEDTVKANKKEAEDQSLIALKYANINNEQLTFLSYVQNEDDETVVDVSSLVLTSTSVTLNAGDQSVAEMKNDNGKGVMRAANTEQTFIKMMQQDETPIYQWIAQSNGHLSLKKI